MSREANMEMERRKRRHEEEERNKKFMAIPNVTERLNNLYNKKKSLKEHENPYWDKK